MLMERRRQATRITLAGSLLSGAAPDELVNRCFSPFFAWKYGSQTRFWGRDYRSAPPLDKAYSGNFFGEFPVPEQIVSFFRFLLSPKFLETPPGEQNSKLRLHLPSRQREPQGLAGRRPAVSASLRSLSRVDSPTGRRPLFGNRCLGPPAIKDVLPDPAFPQIPTWHPEPPWCSRKLPAPLTDRYFAVDTVAVRI